MALGLGTGSTAAFVVEAVGRRLREGTLREVVGVPTSERTAELARRASIPLTTLHEQPALDLALDGADEVAPDLSLIKGRGGALLREKIVEAAARRFVVVVDESKLVDQLGKGPLPVEVIPFGWRTVVPHLESLGATVDLRRGADGQPFITDEGNYILDCRFPGIPDPADLDRRIRSRAGIVETGLFVGLASEVIVAGADGIRVISSFSSTPPSTATSSNPVCRGSRAAAG